MSDVLIQADNVGKKFCRDLKRSLWYGVQDSFWDLTGRDVRPELRSNEFWANQGISFDLKRGECLGLVGRNGAGKTTLLKMLNGLIKPDRGAITIRGKLNAMIALGAGFNPVLTGRENLLVNGAILGLSRNQVREKTDEIIEFAEVAEFIDAPVRTYSSGMQVRLGFATAVTLIEPDVLLLDEVLAVGDFRFRNKCMSRIASILARTAVIFVSHQEAHVRRVCTRAMWLNRGKCEFSGDVPETLLRYGQESEPDLGGQNYSDRRISYSIKIDHEEIDSGDSLKLCADIDSEIRIERVGVRVALRTAGEVPVAEWFSSNHGLEIEINEGSNPLQFDIEHIRLRSGDYYLIAEFLDLSTNAPLLKHCFEEPLKVLGNGQQSFSKAPLLL